MFKSNKEKLLKLKILELKDEVESKTHEKHELTLDLDRIKNKHKMEDENIKHLIKIREEKSQMELDRSIMKAEQDFDRKLAAVKDEYQDNMIDQLNKESESIKKMYGEILKRLPNINVKVKGDI